MLMVLLASMLPCAMVMVPLGVTLMAKRPAAVTVRVNVAVASVRPVAFPRTVIVTGPTAAALVTLTVIVAVVTLPLVVGVPTAALTPAGGLSTERVTVPV